MCVQALLPSKRAVHYEEVLRVIKREIIPNEPRKGFFNNEFILLFLVISDFEKYEIAALQSTFPVAQLSGCIFHLGQSLFRKWRDLGLDRLFGDRNEEGEIARMCFRFIVSLFHKKWI